MADKSTRQKRDTEEFRLQAAKRIVAGGYTYHQAAPQRGVRDGALRCWVKNFRASGPLAPQGRVVPLAEELKAARRELAPLRLENEILQQAVASFAPESLGGTPGSIRNGTAIR
jgi:transposase-like protein